MTIAFKIAGVSPGAEVITTPLTCIAGNQSILALGGTPIWADIDRETGMITKETIEPLITKKTKAIYVLHKEGSPADIEKIYDLKSKYNYIKIIEDAAHAFGAKEKTKKLGHLVISYAFHFKQLNI